MRAREPQIIICKKNLCWSKLALASIADLAQTRAAVHRRTRMHAATKCDTNVYICNLLICLASTGRFLELHM